MSVAAVDLRDRLFGRIATNRIMEFQNAEDRIIQQLRHLIAVHPESVATIGEIVEALCTLLAKASKSHATTSEPTQPFACAVSKHTPLVDPNSHAIHWKGKTCFLGNTLAFKLFARLAMCPNQFLTHATLRDDVWKCQISKEAMRSAVKTLKQKLRAASMEYLAQAIDGKRRECYGLMIGR